MQTNYSALQLASKFINSTKKNIFLTGKAGTGKTTFLRNIVQTTHKKVVVAAPTGIAAINAGGVTLHSLFQLPFGVFVPANDAIPEELITSRVSNPKSLLRDLKMGTAKRKLIREMELLIIDEVSMLRADTLDAIDVTLRTIRRNRNVQFGGVQVLFIGDMQQLPPVVTNNDKPLLDKYYTSPYFFDARAVADEKPIYIELEHIFRQSDRDFIEILNHIRDNILTNHDMDVLNQHYRPNFDISQAQGYINLTTHNYLADQINKQELDKLKGKVFSYNATVSGDFEESAYPVEFTLSLKVGAQVMFIKNDYGSYDEPRYFNGKIGKVEKLDIDSILVKFDDGTPSVIVEPYTWRNNRYSLNRSTNEIEELEIGTFVHYPLKLAWAITVHKSQGLTFQKAIIDVSRAFAPGQIYVALSRLVSLDGLIITMHISSDCLFSDSALTLFAHTKNDVNSLPKLLESESFTYIFDFLDTAFNFNSMLESVADHILTYEKDESHSNKPKHKQWAIDYRDELAKYVDIAAKFRTQIQNFKLTYNTTTFLTLKQRMEAAIAYFEPVLVNLSEVINRHIEDVKTETKVKAYLNELNELNGDIYSRRAQIQKALALVNSTINNDELTRDKLTQPAITAVQVGATKSSKKSKSSKDKQKKEKVKEPSTLEITLELAKQGHSIDEISISRGLANSTITGHIVKLIRAGELDSSNYIDPVKYEQIQQVAIATGSISLGVIRQKLGDEFTYDDIRIALARRNIEMD